MSSRSSSSSCLSTALLIVAGLILIRFGLPELWLIFGRIFSTALYGGFALVVGILLVVGFFTFRNLQRSKRTEVPAQYSRVVRVQDLYRSLCEALQRESISNDVSAEEFLQSEILVGQTLNDIKMDLIRLKDFVSPKNEAALNQQLQDYKHELQETTDSSVKQVIQENLKMLEEKKARMLQTHEEIRQKEASVDLVYHSLVKAEEDLKLGKIVRHLLPADVPAVWPDASAREGSAAAAHRKELRNRMIPIHERLLPYHGNLERREISTLDLVVLHCTELPTLEMAREFGERILYPEHGTGTSGHYYIDRDGSLWRFVEDDRVANHVVGFNRNSIGIELVNTGRYPRWFDSDHQAMTEPYAAEQIEALKDLLRSLRERTPGLINIARHSDLDARTQPAEDDASILVRRRIDPGPMFPWNEISTFWEENTKTQRHEDPHQG